jgi:DNA-binding transcriptional ArsR family regulator
MVNNSAAQLDQIFHALSASTRRGILAQLAREGEATVGDLAAPYEMSAPAISKHLRVLEEAGLIEREIDGRIHRCRLGSAPLGDAAQWIEKTRHFWEERFAALARHLERHPR